jgi:hypothetical protein
MLMMKKPKDLEFEPVHPKNVLLASVVHGISCLLCHFYLPHMEFEGSIGFVSRKMIFFADFHLLGLFMVKKHDLSKKKFSVCHAPLNAKFVPRLEPRP